MRKIRIVILLAAMAGCLMRNPSYCMASEGTSVSSGDGGLTLEGTVSTEGAEGNYTVIRVNAEDDGDGQLLYAIDSDAPEAFGTSSEFTVEKGSEHTIYVKDAAGNISAQVYRVPDAEMDMEVNIGYSNTSSAAMVTEEEKAAAEAGGGNVAEQVITDTGNTAERQFFTVTTKNDHVFYIVVDQSRSDNNVYLLDQVTDEDLLDLAAGVEETDKSSVFSAKAEKETAAPEPAVQEQEPKQEKKSGGDLLFWLAMVLLAAGAFYYYKIYKPKQETRKEDSDAKDLDEFEAEEEEDGERLDFTVSREEKEALMEKILNGNDFDEEELSYDPEQDQEMEDTSADLWEPGSQMAEMEETEEEKGAEEAEKEGKTDKADEIEELEIEEEEEE